MGRHRLSPDTENNRQLLVWCGEQYQRLSGKIHPSSPKISGDLADPDEITETDNSVLKQKATEIMMDINTLLNTTNSDPVPSSPTRQPVINIILKDHEHNRLFTASLASIGGAKRVCDWAISDRPVKWLDDNKLRIGDNVTLTTDIKPDGLSHVLEHDLTTKELNWPLPPDYMRIIHQLFTPPITPVEAPAIKPATKPATKHTTSTRPTKKATPSGFLDLPAILKNTDIDPKEARQALRKSSTPKPTCGWKWPKDEADSILTLITTEVQKLRKRRKA